MFQFQDQTETLAKYCGAIPFEPFLGHFGTETRVTTSPDVCVKVRIACELETTQAIFYSVSLLTFKAFSNSATHIGCSSALAINASTVVFHESVRKNAIAKK